MAGIKQIGINYSQDKWLLKSLDKYLEGEFSPMEGVNFILPHWATHVIDIYISLIMVS